MWPSTSWSLSSLTLNIVFGRASTISPSISIFSSLATGVRLDEADVHRLRSLVADLFLVLHLGVLGEALEALAVDARVVHEEVPVALVRRDEAVALLVVEPLDGSGRHVNGPFLRVPARSVKAKPNHGTCWSSRAGSNRRPSAGNASRGRGVSVPRRWLCPGPRSGTSAPRREGPRSRRAAHRCPRCARPLP